MVVSWLTGCSVGRSVLRPRWNCRLYVPSKFQDMLNYPPQSVTFLSTTIIQNQRCGKFKSRTVRILSTVTPSIYSKLERLIKQSPCYHFVPCTVKKCNNKFCMCLHQLTGSKSKWRQCHSYLISSRLCHVVKPVFGKLLIHGLLSNCIIIIIIMRSLMTIGSHIR